MATDGLDIVRIGIVSLDIGRIEITDCMPILSAFQTRRAMERTIMLAVPERVELGGNSAKV